MLNFKQQIIISFLFFLFLNFNVTGQTDTTSLRNSALKIFLDCEYPDYGSCDVEFMKREIAFVNYVRDRKEAQVHIMITRQNAANGGKKYDILFLGQKEFINENDTLSFVSMADNTEDEIRDKQLIYIKLGLIKYVSHTNIAELLDINFKKNEEEKEEIVKDKWNSWVFNINANTWFNGQSTNSNSNLWTRISAKKITPDWKYTFSINNSYSELYYDFDTSDTTFVNKSNSINGLIVKSLNEHWSLGGSFDIGNSTYRNFDFSNQIYPAIEYNIYPYSQSSEKQMTFMFATGYEYADYIELTSYFKMKENLAFSKLAIAYETKKEWGSIETSIKGLVYLHDISKYDLTFFTKLNIRIIKGLSFNVSGRASLLRAQLNIPQQSASYEDVLLRQKQIASNYSYYMSAGLSYTFGSIYNNIVNPRFDN